MVKEYTLSELSEILGISKQATDKKINKLQKDGLKVIKRSINNRPTKIVFLNDNQLNELINNTVVTMVDDQPEKINNQPNIQPISTTDNQLYLFISELSQKVGKYELLEDKSKEEKENTKHWQDKYFESQNEVKDLIKLNAVLDAKAKELELKNQTLEAQLQKKSFFGLFKK